MALQNRKLPDLINYVENTLSNFYGFSINSRAETHLISRQELTVRFGKKVQELPEFSSRAGVYLLPDSENLFIGLYLDESITDLLENTDPLLKLNEKNLDSFCVLIEEISHFHLILNRVIHQRGVSKLELEWQGEVDKVLISALILKSQSGDPCLRELLAIIFENAIITADQRCQSLYIEANHHAAKFWQKALKEKEEEPLGPSLKKILRHVYWELWPEKLSQLSRAKILAD